MTGSLKSILLISTVASLFPALLGCGGATLKIVRAKTPHAPASETAEPLPGMPFYVKTAGCKHLSIWLQPVYTLSLVVKVDATVPATKPQGGGAQDKDPEKGKLSTKIESTTYTFTKSLSLTQFRDDNVNRLRALLNSIKADSTDAGRASTQLKDTKKAWEAIPNEAYDPFKLPDEATVHSDNVILASNSISPELYVDYNTTYYLNSPKPLSGSSQASFKMADDGTLSEGAAQQESKTLQMFLDLVPFKDVITKLATGPLALAADQGGLPYTPPNAVSATYGFDLKVEVKTYKRTHAAFATDDAMGADGKTARRIIAPPCAAPTTTVEKPQYAAYNYTVQDAAADTSESADKSTIKVNGTVKLPSSGSAKDK